MMKIIAIGEIIFDVFGEDAVIGGAPLNFCAYCSSLGAEAALVSAVGGDDFGEKALSELERFGVETKFVSQNGLSTGKCLVTLNNGIPSYDVLRPAAYDMIEINADSVKEYCADVFAFGTLIQREEKSKNVIKRILRECEFKEIFCDVNLRKSCYDKESCRLCLENATILKISEEEEPLLEEFGFYKSDDNEEKLLMNISAAFGNIKLILFTKGENGSVVFDADKNEFYRFSAVETEVVSTVGAGDSYSAAFICEYLENGDIAKAGEKAAKLSARVVAAKKAIIVT